jgi:hypothetical protein
LRIAIPHTRRRRRRAGAGCCGAVALVAALASVCHVGLLPPRLEPRPLQIAGASTHVVVDLPRSVVHDPRVGAGELESLWRRTVLLGTLMTTPPVLADIGRRAGVPGEAIAASTAITANVPAVLTEPDSERRAEQIREGPAVHRLEVQPHPTLPVLNVYAQAPTPAGAERLAEASVRGLEDHLRSVALRDGAVPAPQVRLEQFGRARGAVINGGAAVVTAGLTFVVVLALSLALLALAGRARRAWKLAAAPEPAPAPTPPPPRRVPAAAPASGGPRAGASWWPAGREARPAGVLVAAAAAGGTRVSPATAVRRARPLPAVRWAAAQAGDWPRTTRILPWSVAGFMAILWLVPFNSIALSASLPIDLKLDRLILPFIIGAWVLILAGGGPAAPRVRLTAIHVALAGYIALACLSIVLDAGTLNRALELDLAVKKLTLLISYGLLFVVVASVVRRSEVRPFLTYTLALAALCALGTIWEYRFHYNVFYSWSDKVLPGVFQVGSAESAGVDEIGRRLVRGPAEIGLETVAMLAMALPIALVSLLHATHWRKRVLYGLAACLLLAAAISTYRKSALIAPFSAILTLAYFRRRELLRLAPLGLVVLVVGVHVLSPGALGSIAGQLDSGRLGVATVSDRTSDYDAIRPDVWSDPAFGRGFGTYEHIRYRILDMEMLDRLVEGGVIGVSAYILLLASVVAVARRPIRRRDPRWSPVALSAAAASVSFLVMSFLFDVMSFPHCPYILLSMAGLLAVAARAPEEAPWSS